MGIWDIRIELWAYGISTDRYDSLDDSYKKYKEAAEKVSKILGKTDPAIETITEAVTDINNYIYNYEDYTEGKWLTEYVNARDLWSEKVDITRSNINDSRENSASGLARCEYLRDSYLSQRDAEEGNLRAALQKAKEEEAERIKAALSSVVGGN